MGDELVTAAGTGAWNAPAVIMMGLYIDPSSVLLTIL